MYGHLAALMLMITLMLMLCTCNVAGAKHKELRANPPELHAAVDAAEAGLVVDVEVCHQPLQGVHGLQTCDARLPHRRAELLTAHGTHVALSIKD